MENTTFYSNVNFSLNVTKFSMLFDTSHVILVAMETILVGSYEFLSCQNVCIYKLDKRSINTLARVLNCISLERAGHQHSEKVCGVCIPTLCVEW